MIFLKMLSRFKNQNTKQKNALFLAFQRGEEWAYAQIYCLYNKPLLGYLARKVGDPEVAKDLGQEVFLKVHRFRNLYEPGLRFSTWLWTIARNTVSDWYRSNERHLECDNGGVGPEDVPSQEPSVEVLLAKVHDRRRMVRLFRRLTRLQRRVLWMRLVREFSYDQIAKNLGLSLASVKCLAYRARKTLFEVGESAVFA